MKTTALSNVLVHKTRASEVLLVDCAPDGPDRFRIIGRWPEEHSFYRQSHGFLDPMLLVESVRQAIPLLSHVAYEAPLGHRQAWTRFFAEIRPEGLRATGTAVPIELHVACSDVVRRAGRLASLSMSVDAFADGVPLARVATDFVNQSPTVYQRVRGRYADLERSLARALPLLPPVPPSHVGRERHADVVLAPTDSAGHAQLRVDLTHPILFDHPVDHVPGMLLLEAARQAAHLATWPRPTVMVGLDCFFARYTEFDSVCTVFYDLLPDQPEQPGLQRVLVSISQDATTVCSAVVTLAATTVSAL